MGGRGAVPVALMLAAGLLAGAGCAHAGALAAVLALLGATVCVALASHGRAATVAWLLVALGLAALARGGVHAARLSAARGALDPAGVAVHFAARVVEPPVDAGEAPAVIASVEDDATGLPRGARIRLALPAGAACEWSDRLRGLAWLESPSPARNPGGFDGLRWAAANDLAANGRAVWCVRETSRGFARWPRATFGRWRTAIERRFALRVSPETRALLVPFVLGDRSELPPAVAADLRVAGLVHLIALSGLHVAWLAALARAIASAAGGGATARSLAGAACALFYFGLAGPIPSLARAAVSELLASLAGLTSRRLDPLQALAGSVVALLVARPAWVLDLGFALSCAATLGLVTFGEAAAHVRGRFGPLARSLLASLGAQLLALPLVTSSFHLLPWIGPAANLVAVPIGGLLLSAAWIALLVDLAAPGFGATLFHAVDALAAALRVVTHLAARVPGAARSAIDDPALAMLAALGAGLLALACARRTPPAAERAGESPRHEAAGVVGAALVLAALVELAGASELRPPAGACWIVGLDVGQGDATAIGTPAGWWLVDAGPRTQRQDAGGTVVLPFLRWAGVRRLEGLVVTHDDSDHTGGVATVLAEIPASRVVASPAREGARGPASRFAADTVSAGERLATTPPIVVLWPSRDPRPRQLPHGITADNANGVVLEVGSRRGRALLLADVDSTTEALLAIASPVALLKAGHHGASQSSGAAFLARMRPRAALVSCGRRNRFGHPDPGVLARLAAVDARVLRTDAMGAVWCELTAAGVRVLDGRHAPDVAAARMDARPVAPQP